MEEMQSKVTGANPQLIECQGMTVDDQEGLKGLPVLANLAERGQKLSRELTHDEISGWLWGIFCLNDGTGLVVKNLGIEKIEIEANDAYVEIGEEEIPPILFICLMNDNAVGQRLKIYRPVHKTQEIIPPPEASSLGTVVESGEGKNEMTETETERIDSGGVVESTDNEAGGDNWEQIKAELELNGIDTKDFSDYEKGQLCKFKPEIRKSMAKIYILKNARIRRENAQKGKQDFIIPPTIIPFMDGVK